MLANMYEFLLETFWYDKFNGMQRNNFWLGSGNSFVTIQMYLQNNETALMFFVFLSVVEYTKLYIYVEKTKVNMI
jgi:hypothetical protein